MVKSCEYWFAANGRADGHVEHVVADAVQDLEPRRDLPVVLREEPVERRVVLRRRGCRTTAAGSCSRAGSAPTWRRCRRDRSGRCRGTARRGRGRRRSYCASMPALRPCLPRSQLRLSITCVMPWLKSKPDRVAVAELRAAERRGARHRDRRARRPRCPACGTGGAARTARAARSACVLPIVDTSCADAESMRSVKSVARSVVVRPPPMFEAEKFLKRK